MAGAVPLDKREKGRWTANKSGDEGMALAAVWPFETSDCFVFFTILPLVNCSSAVTLIEFSGLLGRMRWLVWRVLLLVRSGSSFAG